MSIFSGPEIVNDGLLLALDAANIKIYPGSGVTLTDPVSGFATTLRDSSFYTINANGSVTFTRTTSPTAKDGGGILGIPTGNLTVGNFLYNDHTWEIWFRIDERFPGGYDATENDSALAVFDGYHQGFFYTSTQLRYYVWDNTTTAVNYTPVVYTLGASGTDIIQGQWFNAAVTYNKSTKTFTGYLNGAAFGTPTTLTTFSWNNLYTAGYLSIGKALDATAGTGSYMFYSKSTFGNMKMYNRVLSATEIRQNFNALRGRYGL